jgi:hypothetical protein
MTVPLAAVIAQIVSSCGALAGASWMTTLPGMPPDAGQGLGFAAGFYMCFLSPLVAVAAAVFAIPILFLSRRLAPSRSLFAVAVLVGAVIGLALSLLPVVVFVLHCGPRLASC